MRYLIKAGKVDGAKVAVRGGSAGGYMVQRVMTQYPDLFTAGASYYGIGNLITWMVFPLLYRMSIIFLTSLVL